MASIRTINLAEFALLPGGRSKAISTHSAEEFRDDVVLPTLQKEHKIVINLDGIVTVGSSFLEEVFGGIVRKLKIKSSNDFDSRIEIKTKRSDWLLEANEYIKDAISCQAN